MTADELRRQAVALVRGQPGQALAAVRRAAALAPDDATVLATLATAWIANQRFAKALAALDRALRLGLSDIALRLNRGTVLARLGRWAEAVAEYDLVLAQAPDHAAARAKRDKAAWAAAGALLWQAADRQAQGLPSEAERLVRQALDFCPRMAAAHNNLGNILIEACRLDEAAGCFGEALRLEPRNAQVHSNLLFCLTHDPSVDDAALLAAHRAWDAAQGAWPDWPQPRSSRQAGRRLRLGYVSPNFNQHPVGWFLLDVLHRHDRDHFEVIGYDDGSPRDDFHARLRAGADQWHEVAADGDEALLRRIRDDGIDILVDLAGHTARNRLRVFAARAAPLQVSWLGWFHSTGLTAMDAVIMDPFTVPAGEERWFCERVGRLPHTRFCFPPIDLAPVAPLPWRTRGHVTFGSFNNLAKLNERVVALWAAVLRAVPDSRLVLKWKTLADAEIRRRLQTAFAAHGVAAERLELRPTSPFGEMLAQYGDIDIALDPVPFTGGFTSCIALWMGVPVLTLPGRRPVSRQSHAFLANIGLDGAFSATDPADYVARAMSWAARPQELAALRESLRPRMRASPLCDGAGLARALEAALLELWRDG